MDDRTPELEKRLAERSRRETLREGVGREPPRAMPETLWVLFSYGWQPVKAQHRAQLELYERVKHILNESKPPEFAWLPRIELWRDEERLENAHGAQAQIEAECDRAFLALVMMSRKYPTSAGCMMEFDKFVDAKGENLPRKAAILVGVNCKKEEVDQRFSHDLRLWLYDEGRTLLEGMRRSEAAKDAFAKRIATQIWLAAERYLGGAPAARTAGEGTEAAIDSMAVGRADPVEDYILRRGAPMPLDKYVNPRARTGARRAETVAPEAAPGGEGEGADILKHLTDWAERREGPRMTALLGDFGMGKTVTCQMLTQRLLERRKAAPNGTPLPIYLDLRDIRDGKSAGAADLEALMADMLRRDGEAPLDSRQVIRYAREAGALVIFDGIDEVTNKLTAPEAEALYRTILRIVPAEDWAADREARRMSEFVSVNATPSEAREARPKPRKGPLLLVSCRTHYFPDIATQRAFLVDKDRAGLDSSADVEIWFMLPFNKSQVESYLRQNLGEMDGARALEMIGATYNLEELSTRPILLRFFSETFSELEQEKLKGVTIDIGKLYEKFVDRTLARDGLKHVIPLNEKKILLAELALHFHIEGLNEIANSDLDQWLTREIEAEPALRKLQWGAGAENALTRFELFLQDLRNATLLVRPGEKEFRFGHTSVREFFLAEALHRHIREGRREALGGRPVTEETIDFLVARQRNGASERDARRFREQFPRLLDPGRDKELRWFAAKLVWRAGEGLPWPEVADFSGFDLTNFVFASPGLGEAGAREIPPRAMWRGARLHGARFFGLALSGQNFSGADASSSFWVDCDFSGATTEDLDLSAAELRRCRAPAPLAATATTIFSAGVGCRQGLAALNARPIPEEFDEPRDRNDPPSGPVLSLVLDGRVALASGSVDNTIRLWNPRTGKALRVLEGHKNWVTSLAALEIDGSLALGSGSEDNTIRLWDPRTGKALRVLEGHGDWVTSLAALEIDGSLALASGSDDGTIRLWDPRTGKALRVLEGHKGSVTSLAALEIDGSLALASGSYDNTIRLWDPRTGKALRVLEGHGGRVTSLAALEIDGSLALASGSWDKTIRLWNPRTGKVLRVLEGHGNRVTSLAALEIDGTLALASGSWDNTIRLWNPRTGKALRVLEGHKNWVTSLAALEIDGSLALGSGSEDNTIRLWDPRTGKALRVLEGHKNTVTSLAALEIDGSLALASGSVDSTIRLWDPRTGKALRVLEGHRGFVTSLAALEIDGSLALASGSWDNTIRLWDPRTGKALRVLEGHRDRVASLAALEIDGSLALASGSGDNTIRLWDPRTGKALRVLEGHKYAVTSLAALEIDGSLALASGSVDDTIRLWDPRTGKVLRVLEGHRDRVASLAALEIDGSLALGSGSEDNTIRLWDPRTGKALRVLEGHKNTVTSLAALEIDGSLALASGSDDNTIRLWDPRTGRMLASINTGLGGVRFASGATGGVLAYGWLGLSIDAASLAALIAKKGVATMRRFALDPGYADSFVETKRDAETGKLMQATVGPNAWRDFLAVGYEADGRQSLRPIEDMATAETS